MRADSSDELIESLVRIGKDNSVSRAIQFGPSTRPNEQYGSLANRLTDVMSVELFNEESLSTFVSREEWRCGPPIMLLDTRPRDLKSIQGESDSLPMTVSVIHSRMLMGRGDQEPPDYIDALTALERFQFEIVGMYPCKSTASPGRAEFDFVLAKKGDSV